MNRSGFFALALLVLLLGVAWWSLAGQRPSADPAIAPEQPETETSARAPAPAAIEPVSQLDDRANAPTTIEAASPATIPSQPPAIVGNEIILSGTIVLVDDQ